LAWAGQQLGRAVLPAVACALVPAECWITIGRAVGYATAGWIFAFAAVEAAALGQINTAIAASISALALLGKSVKIGLGIPKACGLT
jgi:hypothetical protein